MIETGRFITFEGAEGAGKSTQIRLAAQYLQAAGWTVLTTREPGGTAIGQRIRDLLLDPEAPLVPLAELFLYAADRAQHVEEIIRPALAAGRIVLCDRHADSLVAYQAFGRGVDRRIVEELNALATAGLVPDRTFVLDLDPAIGLTRAAARSRADRLEGETLDFHLRVREGFLQIAREHGDRIRVIAAEAPPEQVHRAVVAELHSMLDK